MLNRIDRLAPKSLGMLNREPIVGQMAISAAIRALRESGVELNGGMNSKNHPRTGTVVAVDATGFSMVVAGFDGAALPQVYFSYAEGGREYFFAADVVSREEEPTLRVSFPVAIYESDRRGQFRQTERDALMGDQDVHILGEGSDLIGGRVIDQSLQGLGIEVRDSDALGLPDMFEIFVGERTAKKETVYAQIRHRRDSDSERGWVRLGLSVSRVKATKKIEIERREEILPRSLLGDVRAQRRKRDVKEKGWLRAGKSAKWKSEIKDFSNGEDRNLRAYIDSYGSFKDCIAVVIPPSWGKTKETLVGLSETILATFSDANESVTVMRFDGTERRGESYVSPECRVAGSEYHKFTFSGAVKDIQAAVDYLHLNPESRPRATILVTFSLASIEGRRAASENLGGNISGWVSVVGLPELQGALRMMSGGIDYGYGLLRGVRFGLHELAGVVADMDATGGDAIKSGLAFLEGARVDMAKSNIPITWIHGKHDAWIDLEKVEEILSCGNTSNRKLIEIPTGHEIRESHEALQTFQLISEEITEMAGVGRLRGVLPDLESLSRRREREEIRIRERPRDLRIFWRDYLLGRDLGAGMELLSATSAYRDMMRLQIRELACASGDCIADLGAGNGDFSILLKDERPDLDSVSVNAVDYVPEALARCRTRVSALGGPYGIRVHPLLIDLNLDSASSIALRDSACDGVVASLIINYIDRPMLFLSEILRILKPNGRLVVSGLKKDADISKLYIDAWAEMKFVPQDPGSDIKDVRKLDELARGFLNHASRLLQLAEQGVFHLMGSDDLVELVSRAGFRDVTAKLSLGDPPQAVVVSAVRP